ncbi:MAG: PSD1 and planctomycete cytochrome C domain-containing protein [Pirellulaceae bacterium]|nr:PSD1 and planctomycete cytochrome C domain-containing protein [Pirellulaceae bacterium]
MKLLFLFALIGLTCSLVDGSVFAASPSPEPVDFDRAIQPLLADKCFRCHGPDEAAREADLRLDLRGAAVADDADGDAAIIAFDSSNSDLIQRITSDDPDLIMPPPDSKLSLTADEKEIIARWINQGASYSTHWSFRPIQKPPLPTVKNKAWPRNPIDQFILARLDTERLVPTQPADGYRLIRRLYLDLTGKPPTRGEAESFVRDRSPQKYERLVDKLLASPAFGERMAWTWLDAARYADSNGYQGDQDRTMWPWRDWVIEAINQNQPFDQFTINQIAGDMLPAANHRQQLATGFCRNHMINGEGGRIPEENRVDYVMDMTETAGTVWLGLTLNCCRCHDHKFDPLTKRDYYSMFAFFNQTPVNGEGRSAQTPPVLASPTRVEVRSLDSLSTEISNLQQRVSQLESQQNEPVGIERSQETQKLLGKPVADRNTDELKTIRDLITETTLYAKTVEQLREAVSEHRNVQNSLPKVMIMKERSDRRPTFMLDKGLYNQPGESVEAAFPVSLQTSGDAAVTTRLDLANWIMADTNPLTARVITNRIWQGFFGIGIVKTAEDFGTQGERPIHPQLLDWLATEFRDSGWDTKHLYRLIVTSSTYQQSSRSTPHLRERDPENRWLARGARFRLPSWMIRDQALAISGLLVDQVGGAPVNSYQPSGVWEDATFGKRGYRRDSGENLYRRSIYTFWRRIVAPTLFFDTASRQVCTVTRSLTNSPLHALTTLNDVTYVEAARVLATRILDESPDASNQRLAEQVFRRVLIRPPEPSELDILTNSLSRLEKHYATQGDLAAQLIDVGEFRKSKSHAVARLAAMTSLCNLIMNLDETLCRE